MKRKSVNHSPVNGEECMVATKAEKQKLLIPQMAKHYSLKKKI